MKAETQQVTIRDSASGETWRCDGEEYVVAVANAAVDARQPMVSNFRCNPETYVRIVAALAMQGSRMYGDSFIDALSYALKTGDFRSEVL